ncbi:hypothetical protein O1611_g4391 [Lasiodiplodia mahajangana]|uniref:Uncharacterized protein n=1 Tax=Lasiodiplodia mahajangana TaxID=1108764 RepID=A0ACC2JP18_9PEZI|nr:hypothetical protein O1611_g4391 [Lasiodiplodia mahajangana]
MSINASEGMYADTNVPICNIPVAEAFAALSRDEKLYAHHMCRASFAGTRIVLKQTSQESERIYDLIVALYRVAGGKWQDLAAKAEVGSQDLEYFLDYAAMLLANVGNYRSTGDQKFVPRISIEAMRRLCHLDSKTRELFEAVVDAMYSTSIHQYGYSSVKGCASGYYPHSTSVSKEDVDLVQRFLQSKNLLPENTRIIKHDDAPNKYTVLRASAEADVQPSSHSFNLDGQNATIILKTGDFNEPLGNAIVHLEAASNYAASEMQKDMIRNLVTSFRTGDHDKFKLAQTSWVQDRDPTVETIIGFIETYQDPHGVRGAWEGIVAIVNKNQSRKFGELVDRSGEFLAQLPWNGAFVGLEQGKLSSFESDRFVKPDFTSLDTVGFLKSESPAGINLPNFEDICQTVGSKNLEFGNVNQANPSNEKIPFVHPEEVEWLRKYRDQAFEVMIGCHELLGHGSGRLLTELSPGAFNFDTDSLPINPLTGKAITSWYKPGETWASVFGADGSAIEECRADGVSLILLPNRDILSIFGFQENSVPSPDDIVYAGFLTFISGAIEGLSRWSPDTRKWGQAHRQGKFALLQCLLRCGPELLQLVEVNDEIQIKLDRSKIQTHAIPALSQFLLELQVHKSTANYEGALRLFNSYTEVDKTFARYRAIVLKQEPPRIQYVQPNTFIVGEGVEIRDYPATREGLIQSWVERNV